VLSGRSPSKILFAKDSGRLFQLDLLVLYNEKGMVERFEVVPYRLTRNLATFFTAFGVEVSADNVIIDKPTAAIEILTAAINSIQMLEGQHAEEYSSEKGSALSCVHCPS
jgi:hypothetical protein